MKLEHYFSKYDSLITGLSDNQVIQNKLKFGENKLTGKKRENFFFILLMQLGGFFSLVLISAAAILLALGEVIEFYVIIFIILINVLIETVQRYKSDSIFESLTKTLPSYSVVLRNNKRQKIESCEIVVGDILLLEQGNKVSADGIIVSSEDLMVDESILTGESKPVHKQASDSEYSLESIIDNPHALFSGSMITTGRAQILVTQVGDKTQLGLIVEKISTIDTELPIYKNIKKLSHNLFIFIIVFATLAFIIGLSQFQSWVEIFKVTVALCVSGIPESLPVTMTLILAYGFKRMSDKNVLVKKMQSLDVLGQIQTLALDKTGTITRNQMKVEKVYTFDDIEIYITGDGYEPKGTNIYNTQRIDIDSFPSIKNLITYGTLSSDGSFVFDTEKKEWVLESGDPTEVSLLVLGAKNNITKQSFASEYVLEKNIPFTNQSMYHSAIYKNNKSKIQIYTGAPEIIFALCTHIQIGDTHKKIDSIYTKLFHKKINEYASAGYRILATCIEKNSKVIFQGLFAINDSIRLDVVDSVRAVYERGVDIIIITGDHKDIALQVAQKIGLRVDKYSVITGDDIKNLTDTQLGNIILDKKVFARVTPQQKLKILELLKSKGRVVAMTGDGVNDALALVKADIGIAMGTLSSESAKEAADIVLLDNKFGSIVYGIEEGKNIFLNIKKTILFLLSTNFAGMFVTVFAILLMLPLPFSAVSILWINFVTDTFLALGFAFERGKTKDFKTNALINSHDWLRIFYLGLIMTTVSLIVFMQNLGLGPIHAQTMVLLVLIVMQWFNLLNVRAGQQSIFTYGFKLNKIFVLGWGISFGLTLFAFNSEFMRNILGIEKVSLSELGGIFMFASLIIWFEELRKYLRKVKLSFIRK